MYHQSTGNYLHAEFASNRGNAKTLNTYVCFYADFSTPQSNVDLNTYQGIRFKSRLNLTSGNSNNLKLILAIKTPDDNQCHIEHESNYFRPTLIGQFDDIQVEFRDLIEPDYFTGKLPPFDPRAAYRVIFSIRGEDQAGTLDIDDIQFYK